MDSIRSLISDRINRMDRMSIPGFIRKPGIKKSDKSCKSCLFNKNKIESNSFLFYGYRELNRK
jgi:hypothetical protein